MPRELLVDMLYLFLSAVLSGGIGLEREWRNKAAGFRTHVLVGMGTTLLTILSTQAFPSGDPSRIAAQVVSGIGFIGAGVILHRGYLVRGLTTAATLWMTMAIGMAVGLGWIALALAATGFALAALLLLGYIAEVLPVSDRQQVFLDIRVSPQDAPRVRALLDEARVVMRRGERVLGPEGPQVRFSVSFGPVSSQDLLRWVERLSLAGAQHVTWSRVGEEPF